jgi:hypothetical protein
MLEDQTFFCSNAAWDGFGDVDLGAASDGGGGGRRTLEFRVTNHLDLAINTGETGDRNDRE